MTDYFKQAASNLRKIAKAELRVHVYNTGHGVEVYSEDDSQDLHLVCILPDRAHAVKTFRSAKLVVPGFCFP